MPRILIKLEENYYLLWSTVIDAPVGVLNTQEAKEYIKRYTDNPEHYWNELETTGTDHYYKDINEAINGNRCGTNEEELTLEQIKQKYREYLRD